MQKSSFINHKGEIDNDYIQEDLLRSQKKSSFDRELVNRSRNIIRNSLTYISLWFPNQQKKLKTLAHIETNGIGKIFNDGLKSRNRIRVINVFSIQI